MKKFMWLAIVVSIFLGRNASAHPVSYKGAFGVMPEYTPTRKHLELNYSFASAAAVGVSMVEIEHEGDTGRYVLPRFNYRVYRKNELDSQANIYLSGGLGTVRYQAEQGLAGLAAFQGDFETRRFYTLLSGDLIQSESLDHSMFRYRIGVAPYIAEFDGFHTWLIWQVDLGPQDEHEWTFTSVVRFFYNNYLTEFGVSTRGEPFVAGIFHF